MAERWTVQVLDPAGRTRPLVVEASKGEPVRFLTPPGEGYSMTPDRIEYYRQILGQARAVSLRGESGESSAGDEPFGGEPQ